MKIFSLKLYIVTVALLNACQPSKPKFLDAVIRDRTCSFSEFETLVSKTTDICRDTSRKLGELDIIDIVKIDNTISSYRLDTNVLCKTFNNVMDSFNIRKKLILDTADWQLSVGMGLYNKKFDLYWGGLRFPKNSYYWIEGRGIDCNK